MAVSYKDLGLVNSREMFKKAMAGHYAIPAFNFNNMEQLQAIIQACTENESPVILQVSKGARQYANQTLLRYMAQGAVEYSREISNGKGPIPIVLHLDHGDSFELCKSCIDFGFSSVMIDGSSLPYDENVALTRKVVEYAHPRDVTVEGELGVLAGVEDEVSAAESHYTKPEQVVDFVTKTGVDSLAISIGTSHGAYKFTPADRPSRRVLRPAGGSRHHQQIRRSAQGGRRHSGGTAPRSREIRSLQDQHRLRFPPRHDGRRPQGLRGKTRRIRSEKISRPGPRQNESDVYAQSHQRARLRRSRL